MGNLPGIWTDFIMSVCITSMCSPVIYAEEQYTHVHLDLGKSVIDGVEQCMTCTQQAGIKWIPTDHPELLILIHPLIK